MSYSKGKVLTNFLWRFAERCGAQGVALVVSIVLARLIAPEHYGTLALVTVFTDIHQVLVDSGLGSALVQKKDADDLDFSSVFFFNIAVCLILYAGMFFLAPRIAGFYQDMELVPVIRVMSLVLVISGVKNVQQAYVSRQMLFKRFFFATLGGTVVAAVVGIAMAYMGFGVWALVAQNLVNKMIDTIVLWYTVRWRPKLMFSWKRLKGMISYGWKLLAAGLLDTVFTNLRQLVIGKMYTSSDLAYFNRGQIFPNTIVNNVNTSISSVLFPAMSSAQEDPERVKVMTRRSIMVSTYVMAPLLMGLAFCAEPIVSILLTDQWLPCVPFLRIFCIAYMFYPIHTANLSAIKAMGRSDLFLSLEVVKKVVGMILLLVSMWFGVMAMAYSLLISSFLAQLINSWPNRKLLNYNYMEQMKDILPGILTAVGMGICVYLLGMLPMAKGPLLVLQILAGAVIYVMISAIWKIEAFGYLWGMLKPYIMRRTNHG